MKRTNIAIVLACLLFASAFTGCVQKKEANLTAAAQVTAAPTAEPAPTAASEETPAPTAEPQPTAEPKMFPWGSHTCGVMHAIDVVTDGSESEQPEGKFVEVGLMSMDKAFTIEDISHMLNDGDFFVRDAAGKEYGLKMIRFSIDGGGVTDESGRSAFYDLGLKFDVPPDTAVDALTLCVKTETEGETIVVSLADVPGSAAETPAGEETAATPAAAVDNEAVAERVKAEESIDGVKPGVKTGAIEKKLGKADDFPAIEMETMQLFYMSQGYIATYLNSSKVVTGISAYVPAAGMTARGVGVGSTRAEVEAAYADSINAELTTEAAIVVGTEEAALTFNFADGVVNTVTLFY